MSELQTSQGFAGPIECRNVDATQPEPAARVQQLGFKNHGLEITSESGETLWKQPDHEVQIEDVKKALTDLFAERAG